MAEIGLIASIVGLAATAFEISRSIYDLIKTFEDSPQAIKDLAQNVQTLGQVFEQISEKDKRAVSGTQFKRALKQDTFAAAVESCKRDFVRLKLIVEELKPKGYKEFWLKLRNTIKWIYLEKSIESIKKALEAHKSLFNILLSLNIDEKTSQITENTGRILQLIEVVLDRVNETEKKSEDTFQEAKKELDQAPLHSDQTELVITGETKVPSPPKVIESDPELTLSDNTPPQAQQAAELSEAADSDSSISTATPPQESIAKQEMAETRDVQTASNEAQLTTATGSKVENSHTPESGPRIQTPELVKALATAAMLGYVDTVALLLETGVDVDGYDGECTPLWRAADWNQLGTTKLLLEHGANPDLPHKNGESVLGVAARRAGIEIVRMLVAKGADVKVPGLLHRAIGGLDGEKAACIVDAGADVNASYNGEPILFPAIWWQKPDVVDVLLRGGADPTVKNKDQYSPVVYASKRGDANVMRLLLERGRPKA